MTPTNSEANSNTIHGLWIGSILSLMEQLSIRSFLANGFKYCLYTYEHLENVPAGVHIMNANDILPKEEIFVYQHGPDAGSYAGFADQFRYKVLLEEGGWWADLDVVCLRPFNFTNIYVLPTHNAEKGGVIIASCIFRVPAGCEFIRACFEESRRIDKNQLHWGQIGPLLMTRKMKEYHLDSFILPTSYFCPIDHWNLSQFVGGNIEAGMLSQITNNSCGIHLWNEMWRRKNRGDNSSAQLAHHWQYDKNRIYPEDTLLGKLQRKYLC